MALVGCATSSTTSETIVEVAGHVIAKGTFEHWMHVTASRDYELRPRHPVPSWTLPDAPQYTRCIAHLKATAGTLASAPPGTPEASLKKLCEQRYEELRQQVLGSLISGEWLIGEGETLGLTATQKAIEQRMERARRNGYHSEAEFQRDLSLAGETVADQLFRSKIKVFSEAIERRYTSKGAPALQALISGLPKRWAAKTSCRPGYIVPNCRQYKGPTPPEIQLL